MKNRTSLLVFTYLVMVGICVWLMLDGNSDTTSVVVNIVLFVVVGLIFIKSAKLFKEVRRIGKDLSQATVKIKTDFEQEKVYLWSKYQENPESVLFPEGKLSVVYKEYVFEMQRLSAISNGNYKCDISNYINKELIDVTVKKNILNLVPGTMTGLGILGTFIGLSFGLQNFNTGSASEISDSIAPLMDGIKVAFHTSIYGMVFSLIYNYVYKRCLEDTYDKLDEFLDAYNLYVSSDSNSDNASKMQSLIQELPAQIGEQLAETLQPALEKMNETLSSFTTSVDERQLDGVTSIVDKFVDEMNKSLGENFQHLGEVIEETCELQKQNSDFMQNILEKIGDMTANISDINDLSSKTVESLSGYVSEVEKLQKIINENFMSVNLQLDEHNQTAEKMQGYIDTLVGYEKQISETSARFSKDMAEQVEMLGKLENEISEGTRKNLEMLSSKAEEYTSSLATKAQEYNAAIADAARKQIDAVLTISQNTTGDMDRAAQELGKVSQQLNGQLANSLNSTFDSFDKNLTEISKHLSGTISEVRDTTDRVPETVKAAYEGMGQSFADMQTEMESMVHSLDIMQRNLQRWADKMDNDGKNNK